MAVYMVLIKEYEDEERVRYTYAPNEIIVGKIEYNKIKRIVKQIEVINAERKSKKSDFDRAAGRIARIVFRENGVFPDKTIIEA